MPPHVLRQRLSDLDTQIAHHESIIQEFNQQRSAILSELSLVTYPVLTLPPEVTAEIFKWCLDTGLRLLPSVAPLLLTRICRQWRALALSTPALWDRMNEIEFDVHPRTETFIETWFNRAGTRPLSLGIVCPDSVHLDSLQSVILRHASRLQSLDVMADSDSLWNLTAVQSFPILSKLELYSLGEFDEREGYIQLFEIDGAPVLRQLSLEQVLPSMVTMPWAQLTKMTLVLIPLSECLNALRWATSLREFERHSLPEDDDQIISPQLSPVNHSCLISLIVLPRGDEDILPLLTLPCLQSLELGGRFCKYQEYLDDDVVPFLSRVSGTLRTFKVGMSPTVPVQWLHPFTQLTTLELVRSTESPFKTDIIRALDRRTSPDLLPKLQSFVFAECRSNQVDDELLDTLGSRCDVTDEAHARLESFSLIWPEFDYSSDAPTARLPLVNVLPLRALARRGMRIHIGTRDQNSFTDRIVRQDCTSFPTD
ncbi:hypothetical protein B0H16DRAFT_168561 [Mycena metata]|uniref:F-box domain-containing protein n=1 Tax=Mycena metata TaxID=1033252 RepID=A0AAD7NRC6_9AGAR|nr:hypothetical protein B0H16DRAFT_168561 [Mycena metata]